jgi:hypothetical protein
MFLSPLTQNQLVQKLMITMKVSMQGRLGLFLSRKSRKDGDERWGRWFKCNISLPPQFKEITRQACQTKPGTLLKELTYFYSLIFADLKRRFMDSVLGVFPEPIS